jgi:hypothetical protein
VPRRWHSQMNGVVGRLGRRRSDAIIGDRYEHEDGERECRDEEGRSDDRKSAVRSASRFGVENGPLALPMSAVTGQYRRS